jgi:hypothetical protein
MSTLRELVSNIRSTHRILSTDSMITDRAIASEIRRTSLLLIKRETNLRKLWATDTLFTTIPCLEMIEVPISDCGDFVEDLTIARSKYKLPKIAEGTYNYVIQGVYSINVLGGTGKKLKEISINRYLNLLKLPSKKNEEYFWINNDYLYVTSAFVEKVRISALFTGDIPNEIMYPEIVCASENFSLEDYCMNPLDKEFYLPGYLEKQVMEYVSKTLRETYFQIQQDVTNEGVDGQQVNSTATQ